MKIKYSISMIKNTFLRRLCVIVFVPVVIVLLSIVNVFIYLHYFMQSLKDFFEYAQNDFESLIDAIVDAWNGK